MNEHTHTCEMLDANENNFMVFCGKAAFVHLPAEPAQDWKALWVCADHYVWLIKRDMAL